MSPLDAGLKVALEADHTAVPAAPAESMPSPRKLVGEEEDEEEVVVVGSTAPGGW